MPRTIIRRRDEAPETGFPALHGVSGEGPLASRALISGGDRPISLWIHRLGAGSRISWDRPPAGHALYLIEGSAQAGGQTLEAEGALLVEHQGSVALVSGAEGATLLHFHERENPAPAARKPGGNVHLLHRHGIFQSGYREDSSPITLFADSGCPTCDLWLHRSRRFPAGHEELAHYHTVDEVLVVVAGAMLVGRRLCDAGTAIAIDAHTTYRFKAGPAGHQFVNFRAADPCYVAMPRDGTEPPALSERLMIRGNAFPGMKTAA